VNDSGNRREFGTGAVRDVTTGKGWYAGISPIAMHRLAIVLQKGAEKYSPRNWEQGIILSSFFDSAMRHLFQWARGDVDEDHLGQALWNIHSLIHTEDQALRGKLPRELLDMGPQKGHQVCIDLKTKEDTDKFLGRGGAK